MIALPMVTALMVHTVVALVCGEERSVLEVVQSYLVDLCCRNKTTYECRWL